MILFFFTRLSTVEAKGPGSQRHKSSLTEGPFCRRRALEVAATSEWRVLVLKAEVCAVMKKRGASWRGFSHKGGDVSAGGSSKRPPLPPPGKPDAEGR